MKVRVLLLICFACVSTAVLSGLCALAVRLSDSVGERAEAVGLVALPVMFICILVAPPMYLAGVVAACVGSWVYRKEPRIVVQFWVAVALGAMGWVLAGYTFKRMSAG